MHLNLPFKNGTLSKEMSFQADVKKKILKRIQHDLKGSFGEPAKYVYEATIADGYVYLALFRVGDMLAIRTCYGPNLS